jgi:two-component system NarL family sensor kinase
MSSDAASLAAPAVRPWWRPGLAAVVAWSLWAAVVAVLPVSFLLLGHRVLRPNPVEVVAAVPLPMVGALLVAHRKGGALGWLLLLGGLGLILKTSLYPDVRHTDMASLGMRWVAWANQQGYSQSMVALATAALLFPDGRLPGRGWRWLRPLPLLAAALFVLASLSVWPGGLYPVPVHGPVEVTWFGERFGRALRLAYPAGMVVMGTIVAGALAGLIKRWRRGNTEQRVQLAWGIWAVAASAAIVAMRGLFGLFWTGPVGWLDAALLPVCLSILPVSMGIAITRHRLWDLDLVVNWTLTYLVLTTVLVLGYAGVVTAVSRLLHGSDQAASLLGAALVAVAFAPLRQLLQRTANRLVFGRRDEPYEALAGLARRLDGQLSPSAVPQAIVDGVASTLHLPFVAVDVGQDGRFTTVVARGRLAGEPLHLPLTYRGGQVGRLTVGPRSPSEGFTRRERRLLADLAHPAGVAISAARLTADLQRSRERLVAAREEERRRIWRDLHDGLGPTLTGVSFGIEAVRNRLGADGSIGLSLAQLRAQVEASIAEVRRLVYDLRPPLLEELGLPAAVQRQGAGVAAGGLEVGLEVDGELDGLPAATELAAYRIAVEAMANAARHAGASRCTVCLRRTADALTVEVHDDGRGLGRDTRPGGGLVTMRQRAQELGGSCTIEPGPRTGTTVRATLPLAKP